MIPGYLSGALRDKPAIPGYQWRARAYPMATLAIERAEAEHGQPVPTCLHCGGRLRNRRGGSRDFAGARCDSCGKGPS